MEDAKRAARRATAEHIIGRLARRNMTGHYRDTAEEAVALVRELVPAGASVTWGGSASFVESGVKAALAADGHPMLDQHLDLPPAERKRQWAACATADWMFLSANAITLDGELVNIDGNANRLSLLLHGPDHVAVICGMNKVVADVDAALKRIRTTACPVNAARLHTGTPCELTGTCADCHAPGCMCCQEVITRHSRHDGRIHVILVGEPLGF